MKIITTEIETIPKGTAKHIIDKIIYGEEDANFFQKDEKENNS